jgi:hypothetical protein
MDKILEAIQTMEMSIDPMERNRLALDLSETKDARVKASIVNLLRRPDLKDSRATLVHSLGGFENGDILKLLVDLVVSGNWEVAQEALILINGIDHVEGEEVKEAFSQVKRALTSQGGEPWRRELLQELEELFD